MARHRTAFVAFVAIVLAVAPLARRSVGAAQRVTLDSVLVEYLGGDFDVIQRTFVRSLDFQNRLRIDKPRELDLWLGPWNRGKALLLLELARTSASVAPQYVYVIADAGRRYIATAQKIDLESTQTANFVQVWHRAAVALIQGASDPLRVEDHVANLQKDARLLLARAVAQERRCWADRPSLDQPAVRIDGLLASAGVEVPEDSVGLSKGDQEAARARHSVCLREALSRFEAAAGIEDIAAEARVRGGWTLFQDGRAEEALKWLDAAKPQDDRDLEYWQGLFRGRALGSLGRYQDAANAYQSAFALYPRAQAAGLGLSVALMHLDRPKEADEISRSVREGGPRTPDPWEYYNQGDRRFAGRWIDSLRTFVR